MSDQKLRFCGAGVQLGQEKLYIIMFCDVSLQCPKS